MRILEQFFGATFKLFQNSHFPPTEVHTQVMNEDEELILLLPSKLIRVTLTFLSENLIGPLITSKQLQKCLPTFWLSRSLISNVSPTIQLME